MRNFFKVRVYPNRVDVSLLVLRLLFGSAMAMHGWGKIQSPMSWAGPESSIPGVFQFLAAFSEFGGGIALALGLVTRLASLGLVITMIVAVCMHKFVLGDPFVAAGGGRSYELAAIYFAISLLYLAAGPGRYSVDRKVFGTENSV